MKKTFKLKKLIPLISLLCSPAFAGELLIAPIIDFKTIATNNVNTEDLKRENALVTQIIPSLKLNYYAAHADFNMEVSNSFTNYSHDGEENGSMFNFKSEGSFDILRSGLNAVVMSSISEHSRSFSDSSLVDLVPSDTTTLNSHKAGFEYNRQTSAFNLNGRLLGEIVRSEDGIDEKDGVNFALSGMNGPSSKHFFWRADSSYANYDSERESSMYYKSEVILGWITDLYLNPFARIYNEDTSGSISDSQAQRINSIGLGFNLHLAPSISIFVSHNKASESSSTDDYTSARIEWNPSVSTKLNASFGRRFYGNTYDLNFRQTRHWLTNDFTYKESLSAFDRNSYERESLGYYWCPNDFVDNVNECTLQGDGEVNRENSQLIEFSRTVPVQAKEYSLNRTAQWIMVLNLHRTKIKLSAKATQRKHLTSDKKDLERSASIEIKRDLNSLSDISIGANYREAKFDVKEILGQMTSDNNRVGYIRYKRDINSTMNASLEFKRLNRISNNDRYEYNFSESRLTLSFTKEF